MQRTGLAAAGLALGFVFSIPTIAAAQGPLAATPSQLRACRSEADRRLPDYSYEQVQVLSESRDQNVATVRWEAGSQAGRCTVATNGRILAFTRDAGSGNAAYPGSSTRITCESRQGDRQECRIPSGARIRLLRQLSENPCRLNDTYGQGLGYLWVAEGCRGEFEVTVAGYGGGPAGGGTMRLVCEAQGNTRHECPIPPGADVRLARQLSQFPCRLNESYGVTARYIWVQRGCRADFVVTGGGTIGGGGYTTRMTCESQSAVRQQCPVAGATQIRLVRQLSTNPCRLNETFGMAFGYIWVSNGCRGEFEVTIGGGEGRRPVPFPGRADRVTCESRTGERAECRIRNGGQVQLIKQLSTASCVRNSTWGTGFNAIWVSKGCRGEFEVR